MGDGATTDRISHESRGYPAPSRIPIHVTDVIHGGKLCRYRPARGPSGREADMPAPARDLRRSSTQSPVRTARARAGASRPVRRGGTDGNPRWPVQLAAPPFLLTRPSADSRALDRG